MHDDCDEDWTLMAGFRAGRQGAREERSRGPEWRLGWLLGRRRHEQESGASLDGTIDRVLERQRNREKRQARATAQWLHHHLGRPDKPPRKSRAHPLVTAGGAP